MDRHYNVTIEYFGLKKRDEFPQSTICLGKDGAFLVMDADGQEVRFAAKDCKVEQIAAHVIILRGYTDKPRHITAYCVYANNYDGLCCLDVPCGCLLEDLAPCGEMSEKCRPGHRENVDKHTPCECDGSGEDHWHIVAHGDFGVVNEEDAKQWVCECGAVCDPLSSEWRWNGMEWEHHHDYPVGHVTATKMPNATNEVEANEARETRAGGDTCNG